jgi:hypothetical protein
MEVAAAAGTMAERRSHDASGDFGDPEGGEDRNEQQRMRPENYDQRHRHGTQEKKPQPQVKAAYAA